jgi:hypothetical protein
MARHQSRKGAKRSGSVIRTNPGLWERSKKQALAKMGGKHSARAMQYAVYLYKKAGGRYKGSKPSPATNSLARWTAEKWGYVGGKRGNRYLPERVRGSLTPDERRRTNAAKRRSSSRGRQWSRQPVDVAKKASRIRRSMRWHRQKRIQ